MWGVIIALVIIGLIAAVVMLAMKNNDLEEANEEREEREEEKQREIEISSAHEITRANRGDVVIFEGADEDYEDINLTVERINRYENPNTGFSWNELSGRAGGGKKDIEVIDDSGDLYISMDMDVDITLRDLGLEEADLARMDEEQDRGNTFEYDGKTYRYSESSETMYYKNGQGSPEGYWSWDFECVDDDSISIYVEKWEDEPFEVGMSRSLIPASVKVYPTT